MIRTMLTLVTALALQSADITAQVPPSIVGRWAGKMGPTGEQPTRIFVELNYDGSNITGRVTGPDLSQPGNIRKGTFQPSTGAVAFEAAVEGGPMIVNFEGKLSKDSISGTVKSNTNLSGDFSIGRSEIPMLIPPAKAVDTVSAALQSGFVQVSGWVTKATQLVPPERYTYKPVGTVRTFGQMVAHVIDGYAYYCGRGAGRNVAWSDATEKAAVDKTSLATKLKQATDACTAAYGSAKQLPALLENIGHTNLHYGNIVTYMRMMGLVPPSS